MTSLRPLLPDAELLRGGLSLSGRMNVVPGEEPQWQSTPFAPRETGNGCSGRGASKIPDACTMRFCLTEGR